MMVGGGLLCGAAVAGVVLLLAGHTEDVSSKSPSPPWPLMALSCSRSIFHLSGVLATLAAGLMLGNLGPLGAISIHGREAVQAFWDYAAFVANSLVFLLIGMHVARENFAAVWLPAVAAILLVVLGRAVAIYPCCFLFSWSALRVTWRHQHILFWGGLRGALALALALGLPPKCPPGIHHHHQLCRGRILRLCAGPDDDAALAKIRRISGAVACADPVTQGLPGAFFTGTRAGRILPPSESDPVSRAWFADCARPC